MAQVFSSTSSEGNGTIYPVISGDYIPALDNSSFEYGLGVVALWGGGPSARVPGDADTVSLVGGSQQPGATPITGNSLTYNIEGVVGPQGAQGPQGPPGSITTLRQQVFVPYGESDLADTLEQIRDTWENDGTILYSEYAEIKWDRPWDPMDVKAGVSSWNDASAGTTGAFLGIASDDGLFTSINTGTDWTETDPGTENYSAIRVAGTSGQVVAVGDTTKADGTVWTSTDSGANWSKSTVVGDGDDESDPTTLYSYTTETNPGLDWVLTTKSYWLENISPDPNSVSANISSVNLKLKGTYLGGNYVIRVQFLNLDDELSDYVEETLALTTAYSVETLTFSSPVSAKIADNKLYIRITVVSGPDPQNVAIFKGGTPQLPYVVVAGTWVTEDTDAVNNIDLASDGSNLLACSADGVWLSDDLGVSWTQYKPDSADDTSWTAGVISTSGTYVVVFDSGGNCYRSANSGTAWSAIDPADGDSFTPVDIDSSDNGQYVLVVGTNTTDSSRTAFRSEDYGATWAAINPTITAGNYNWTQCQISNTGRLIGLSRSGAIYMSWNEGVLWEGQSLPTSGSTWDGFAISGDGKVGIIANTAADNEWFQNSGWYERPIFGETAITETARSILDDTTTAGVATTIGLGTGDSPAFTGLSLSGLTASRLMATDASKNLTSLASPLIVGEGGTGAATLTDGGIVLGSGTGAVTVLAQATDGQLPIGSTGLDPVLATITGTAGEIVVTNAAGSITLSLGSAIGDIAALTPTDSNFIVGDGSNWVAESGATARTSIGLGTGDSPQFTGLSLTDTQSIQITSPDNAKNCFDLDLFTSQTSDIVSCQCAYFTITNQGSGGVTGSLRALQTVCLQNGSGTVADAYCLMTQVRHYHASGTLTNASGVRIDGPSITSTGTIGTLYGLLIEAQNHANVTTAYGVYQVGADDDNYFAGDIHGNKTIRADTTFSHDGTDGISTTFVDADGNTITVSGGIITAKTAP